jgi:hypothetical protein
VAGTERVLGRDAATHDMGLLQTTLLHSGSSNASQLHGSAPWQINSLPGNRYSRAGSIMPLDHRGPYMCCDASCVNWAQPTGHQRLGRIRARAKEAEGAQDSVTPGGNAVHPPFSLRWRFVLPLFLSFPDDTPKTLFFLDVSAFPCSEDQAPNL